MVLHLILHRVHYLLVQIQEQEYGDAPARHEKLKMLNQLNELFELADELNPYHLSFWAQMSTYVAALNQKKANHADHPLAQATKIFASDSNVKRMMTMTTMMIQVLWEQELQGVDDQMV
jgi:hypothetical protein